MGDAAPCLPFEILLRYEEQEAQRWEAFFQEHPGALEAPTDIGDTHSVRELLVHVFGVAHRSGERLLEQTQTPDASFRARSVTEIFDIGRAARAKLRQYLASCTPEELSRVREFPSATRGKLSASPQKLLGHALLHGVRHGAQLATLLRQHGYPQDWPHDLLFSEALK